MDPALVTYGRYSSDEAGERMIKLLEDHPDLDAVFANSDLMAIAAMKILQVNGRRVPQDVAVVGYDNLTITGITTPALTSVSQNISVVGRLLAQNLIAYLQSGMISNVTVPAELVIRSSS